MGREMVEYPEARRHVKRTFRRFTGREPPPSAYKQALFPEGSELIVITLLLSYVLGDAETACGEGRHSPALRLLLAWFVSAFRTHQRRLLEYLEAEVPVLDTDYHPISGVD
jgi:hypothetical protein